MLEFGRIIVVQSLGHLNVVPTDQQRVIGSPAPAAIRKMNERHRKKKLVSKCHKEKLHFEEFFSKVYLFVGSFQFRGVSIYHPLSL